MKIIWNDPPEPGVNGEDGVTEYMTKCTAHGKAANMVYRNRGARGAIVKGYVIGCSKECGENASGGRKAPKVIERQATIAEFMGLAPYPERAEDLP